MVTMRKTVDGRKLNRSKCLLLKLYGLNVLWPSKKNMNKYRSDIGDSSIIDKCLAITKNKLVYGLFIPACNESEVRRLFV